MVRRVIRALAGLLAPRAQAREPSCVRVQLIPAAIAAVGVVTRGPPAGDGGRAPPIPRAAALIAPLAKPAFLSSGRAPGARDAPVPLARQPLAPRSRAALQ